jgi:hypothetical protein
MTISSADYTDEFSVATEVRATPEQWARAMFGDEPTVGELLIWRGLLGLRLSRGRSPATVGGWRIAARREDSVRLEAASWLLSANLVVRTTGGRVALETSLHYDRRMGRVVWPPLSAVHRMLVPGALRAAVARRRAIEATDRRVPPAGRR